MKDRISVMIPEEKIKSRIAELGEEISRDYEGKSIHMICVLKGGVYFMTLLSREISEYGSTVSAGTFSPRIRLFRCRIVTCAICR